MQEMLDTPAIGIAVGFPLRINVQQGQMIGFGDEELLARGIGFFLAFLWAVEDAGDGEHGDDGEHFLGAAVVLGGDDEFRQRGIHGEGGHLFAHGG